MGVDSGGGMSRVQVNDSMVVLGKGCYVALGMGCDDMWYEGEGDG